MAQRRQTRTIKRQKPKDPNPANEFPDDTISEEEWDKIEARSKAAAPDDTPDPGPDYGAQNTNPIDDPVAAPDPQPQRPRRIERAERVEPPVGSPEAEARKSKRELFKSSIKERLGRTRKSIEVLGNCGNRASYEYTVREAEQVIEIVEKALDGLRTAFAEKQREADVDFDFDEE